MIYDVDFSTLAIVTAEALAKLAQASDQIAARRWSNAIQKALRIMRDGSDAHPVSRASDGLIMLSSRASGRAYYATAHTAQGNCQCEAHKAAQPCWHVAAARLVMRHDERQAARLALRNVA